MCNILTRLDSLNQQLMIISKFQKMEEECNMYPIATCNKCSTRNFAKAYHCAHHILSSSKFSCGDKCILYNDRQKKIPCNSRTCKSRRKLLPCSDIKLAEVQTDLNDDALESKSINVDMKNDVISQDNYLQVPEQSNKSDQINLDSQSNKTFVSNKVSNTHEEKSEQIIPTKDHFLTESGTTTSNATITQTEAQWKEKAQNETDEYIGTEDTPVQDNKLFQRIQKDLSNERKRTKELEKKIKSLTCSLKCLKEDQQRAACLRNAEETESLPEVGVKLSKAKTNLTKNKNKDDLFNEVAKLQQKVLELTHENAILTQDRDTLKSQLQSHSEEEAKRCEEIEKEVNKMKDLAKEKEDALNMERAEFMNMIRELTNVIKIQKRRICEVTGICNNQQHTLQEKDKELREKNIELAEVQKLLNSSSCICKTLEEKIEDLECCLNEEKKTCNCLKEELETRTENHSSELRIKEKIVEEQNKTISRQRKLLQDTEKMAQQVACEFDELKDELYTERQRNNSLQIKLDETDTKLNKAYLSQCEQCRKLINEIDCLKKEKHRALTVAKLAYQKLHQSIRQYQSKLIYERQQYRYMVSIINKREQEIGCLKQKICQYNGRSVTRMNGYIT